MPANADPGPFPSEQWLRDRAYFLWLRSGRPEGHAGEHWNRAQREYPSYLAWHARVQRAAQRLWEREGRPEGRHLSHWAAAEQEVMVEDII